MGWRETNTKLRSAQGTCNNFVTIFRENLLHKGFEHDQILNKIETQVSKLRTTVNITRQSGHLMKAIRQLVANSLDYPYPVQVK